MPNDLSQATSDADNSMGDRPVGETTEPCPNHWIEIELVDEADHPVVGQPFSITLPDGSFRTGRTDAQGVGRLEMINTPGECQISFTELDQEAWERIQGSAAQSESSSG